MYLSTLYSTRVRNVYSGEYSSSLKRNRPSGLSPQNAVTLLTSHSAWAKVSASFSLYSVNTLTSAAPIGLRDSVATLLLANWLPVNCTFPSGISTCHFFGKYLSYNPSTSFLNSAAVLPASPLAPTLVAYAKRSASYFLIFSHTS